jgi:hypothetical protein
MIYSDNEITRTIIEFATERGWGNGIPEGATFDDLNGYLNDLSQHVRATFPGISEKQALRSLDPAIAEPEPTALEEAEQAARSQAIAHALRDSGATNLLELDENSARALSDKLAAIPKAPKGH